MQGKTLDEYISYLQKYLPFLKFLIGIEKDEGKKKKYKEMYGWVEKNKKKSIPSKNYEKLEAILKQKFRVLTLNKEKMPSEAIKCFGPDYHVIDLSSDDESENSNVKASTTDDQNNNNIDNVEKEEEGNLFKRRKDFATEQTTVIDLSAEDETPLAEISIEQLEVQLHSLSKSSGVDLVDLQELIANINYSVTEEPQTCSSPPITQHLADICRIDGGSPSSNCYANIQNSPQLSLTSPPIASRSVAPPLAPQQTSYLKFNLRDPRVGRFLDTIQTSSTSTPEGRRAAEALANYLKVPTARFQPVLTPESTTLPPQTYGEHRKQKQLEEEKKKQLEEKRKQKQAEEERQKRQKQTEEERKKRQKQTEEERQKHQKQTEEGRKEFLRESLTPHITQIAIWKENEKTGENDKEADADREFGLLSKTLKELEVTMDGYNTMDTLNLSRTKKRCSSLSARNAIREIYNERNCNIDNNCEQESSAARQIVQETPQNTEPRSKRQRRKTTVETNPKSQPCTERRTRNPSCCEMRPRAEQSNEVAKLGFESNAEEAEEAEKFQRLNRTLNELRVSMVGYDIMDTLKRPCTLKRRSSIYARNKIAQIYNENEFNSSQEMPSRRSEIDLSPSGAKKRRVTTVDLTTKQKELKNTMSEKNQSINSASMFADMMRSYLTYSQRRQLKSCPYVKLVRLTEEELLRYKIQPNNIQTVQPQALEIDFPVRRESIVINETPKTNVNRLILRNGKQCVLCIAKSDDLTNHYVNRHKTESYISRLTDDEIKWLSKNTPYAVSATDEENDGKFEVDCVFCKKKVTDHFNKFHNHFSLHTGEYAFKCSHCGLRRAYAENIEEHIRKSKFCDGARTKMLYSYFGSLKQIELFCCTLCNFVQLNQENIMTHLKKQHFLHPKDSHTKKYVIASIKFEEEGIKAEIEDGVEVVNEPLLDVDEQFDQLYNDMTQALSPECASPMTIVHNMAAPELYTDMNYSDIKPDISEINLYLSQSLNSDSTIENILKEYPTRSTYRNNQPDCFSYALFKCMAIGCFFASKTSANFLKHLNDWKLNSEQHIGYLDCAYCYFNEDGTCPSPESLIEHIEKAHGHSSYQCQVCFYRSCELGNVQLHMQLSHKDVKKSRKNVLQNRSETIDVNAKNNRISSAKAKNIKKISCNSCTKGFYALSSLEEHMQKVHHNSLLSSDAKYQCIYCTNEFKNINEAKVHLTLKHPDEWAYVCQRKLKDCTTVDAIVNLVDIALYENHESMDIIERKDAQVSVSAVAVTTTAQVSSSAVAVTTTAVDNNKQPSLCVQPDRSFVEDTTTAENEPATVNFNQTESKPSLEVLLHTLTLSLGAKFENLFASTGVNIKRLYKCTQTNCTSSFLNCNLLCAHMKKRHSSFSSKCYHCDGSTIEYKIGSELQEHIEQHRQHSITCFHCESTFANETLAEAHMRNEHPEIPEYRKEKINLYQLFINASLFNADKLGLYTELLDMLDQRLKRQKKEFEQSLVNTWLEEYDSSSLLWEEQPNILCIYRPCTFEAKLNQQMSVHWQDVHSRAKPYNFVCRCRQRFVIEPSTFNMLTEHLDTHSKPGYLCLNCKYINKYVGRQAISKHVREKHNYKDEIVLYTESVKNMLKYQIWIIFAEGELTFSTMKQCFCCGESNLQPNKLIRHLRLNHHLYLGYYCDLCALEFETLSSVRGHFNEKHEEKKIKIYAQLKSPYKVSVDAIEPDFRISVKKEKAFQITIWAVPLSVKNADDSDVESEEENDIIIENSVKERKAIEASQIKITPCLRVKSFASLLEPQRQEEASSSQNIPQQQQQQPVVSQQQQQQPLVSQQQQQQPVVSQQQQILVSKQPQHQQQQMVSQQQQQQPVVSQQQQQQPVVSQQQQLPASKQPQHQQQPMVSQQQQQKPMISQQQQQQSILKQQQQFVVTQQQQQQPVVSQQEQLLASKQPQHQQQPMVSQQQQQKSMVSQQQQQQSMVLQQQQQKPMISQQQQQQQSLLKQKQRFMVTQQQQQQPVVSQQQQLLASKQPQHQQQPMVSQQQQQKSMVSQQQQQQSMVSQQQQQKPMISQQQKQQSILKQQQQFMVTQQQQQQPVVSQQQQILVSKQPQHQQQPMVSQQQQQQSIVKQQQQQSVVNQQQQQSILKQQQQFMVTQQQQHQPVVSQQQQMLTSQQQQHQRQSMISQQQQQQSIVTQQQQHQRQSMVSQQQQQQSIVTQQQQFMVTQQQQQQRMVSQQQQQLGVSQQPQHQQQSMVSQQQQHRGAYDHTALASASTQPEISTSVQNPYQHQQQSHVYHFQINDCQVTSVIKNNNNSTQHNNNHPLIRTMLNPQEQQFNRLQQNLQSNSFRPQVQVQAQPQPSTSQYSLQQLPAYRPSQQLQKHFVHTPRHTTAPTNMFSSNLPQQQQQPQVQVNMTYCELRPDAASVSVQQSYYNHGQQPQAMATASSHHFPYNQLRTLNKPN